MEGEQWNYIDNPAEQVRKTNGLTNMPVKGGSSQDDVRKMDATLSKQRSNEILSSLPKGENHWSEYPQRDLEPTIRRKAS